MEHDPQADGAAATRLQRQLSEAFDELWDSFVDPRRRLLRRRRHALVLPRRRRDARAGPPAWSSTSRSLPKSAASAARWPPATSSPSTAMRTASATSSAAATATACWPSKAASAGDPCLAEVQAVLDEFVRVNKWHKRQQEIVRRKDRDGECFLRLFAAPDGTIRLRFVEPGQVATPPEQSRRPGGRPGHPDRSGRRGDRAGLLDRRPVGRRRRNPAPQGQRRRQRAARAAAVLSRCARTSAGPRSCCAT